MFWIRTSDSIYLFPGQSTLPQDHPPLNEFLLVVWLVRKQVPPFFISCTYLCANRTPQNEWPMNKRLTLQRKRAGPKGDEQNNLGGYGNILLAESRVTVGWAQNAPIEHFKDSDEPRLLKVDRPFTVRLITWLKVLHLSLSLDMT